MRYLFIFLLLLGCATTSQKVVEEEEKKITITLHNDSEVRKTYWLKWINHPYGCFIVPTTGLLQCEFSRSVGETAPGASHEVQVNVGEKYCVVWENTLFGTRTEETEKKYCFEITEETESVFVDTNGAKVYGVEDRKRSLKGKLIRHVIKDCCFDDEANTVILGVDPDRDGEVNHCYKLYGGDEIFYEDVLCPKEMLGGT